MDKYDEPLYPGYIKEKEPEPETFMKGVLFGTPKGGHHMFYEILDELADIHAKKNLDYNAGDDPLGNLKMCEQAGVPAWKGVIIRLTDKMSRLLTFAKKENYEIKDETVEDTLKDMAVYSILGLILYREGKSLIHDKTNITYSD